MNRRVTSLIASLAMAAATVVAPVFAQDMPPAGQVGGVEIDPVQPPQEQPELSAPDADTVPLDPAEAKGFDAIEALLGNSILFQGNLLNNGGNPANGVFDFRFRLFNSPVAGAQVGPTLTSDDQTVVDGKFSVVLDFGNIFNGTAYHMEVASRPGPNNGAYAVQSPRQALTPVPYAQFARAAGSVFAQTNASGVPSGDGFRLGFDANFFNQGGDALLIEKTDVNTAAPDGGIVFANTGNTGARTAAMIIRGNGKVGIGQTNPAYRLTVRDINHQLAIVDSDNAEKTWTLTSHQSSGGIGFWENGADGRLLVKAGGNVGIGTSDPQSRLHVNNGAIRLTSPQFARINMLAIDPASDVHMFMDARGDGTNRGQLGTISNHGLVIFTNSTARMVISNNGDICIGAC